MIQNSLLDEVKDTTVCGIVQIITQGILKKAGLEED
jgi:hypothetical protein